VSQGTDQQEASPPADAPPPEPPRKKASLAELLAELRRRRVFRVMAGYGIFAFAVLQVIEPIMHGAHLGDWVLTAALVALAIGFPVAVILSWVFDFTAEGVVRTPSASGGPRMSRGRVAALLIGVGLIAALPGVGWYAWKRGREAAGVAATSGSPSVAVLPFDDLSPGHDQEYFSDGIAGEILNALSRIEGLKVPGRASSFWFKGKRAEPAEIASKLGVAHLLEGSVRRSGKRLRIDAEVIRVADGSRLWAQTFERDEADVFAVQDEIARAVAEALRVKLLPGAVPASPALRTASTEAYNAYLMGQQLFHHFSEDSIRRSVVAFERALGFDPGYAPAWAGLANAVSYLAEQGPTVAQVRALKLRSLEGANRAVALAPGLAEGYVARTMNPEAREWDWAASLEDCRKGVELSPRDALAHLQLGFTLAALLRLHEAQAEAALAVELDPLSSRVWDGLGWLAMADGQYEQARKALERSLELNPDNIYAVGNLARLHILQGRPAEALTRLERGGGLEPYRLEHLAMALHDLGRGREARATLDTLRTRYADTAAYSIAEVHAWLGEADQAFAWLERARLQWDGSLYAAGFSPMIERLRGDPRRGAVLRSVNLPVDVAAAAAPAAALAPSIAVLAFDDLSEKHDQGYFADGVAEEILNALAHVEGLRVPGRTSSFWFKGKGVEPAEIGRKLAVTHLLEGSVRRSGKRVRVTAQIVNIADGGHLWSETFERSEADIFAVQDEVARAVAQALRVRLLPNSGSTADGTRTSNPEVYRLYLLGRQQLRTFNQESNARAIASFKQALALEPTYAPAWAGLAHATFLSSATFEADSNVTRPAVLAAAEKAIALAPGVPDGYAVRAELRRALFDFAGAHADIERALSLSPNDANTLVVQARLLANEGRLAESLKAARRAVDLDPLHAEAWVRLSSVLVGLNDLAGVRTAVARAEAINGKNNPADYYAVLAELLAKEPAAALEVARRSDLAWVRLTGVAMAQHSLGRAAESQEALDELISGHQREAAYQVAEVYAWRGEQDRALAWLDRAYNQRDTGLGHLTYDPALRLLRGDPRFRALLKKLKLPVD
jgi:TolB-like protein/Tfp pilus assembly protein PilF